MHALHLPLGPYFSWAFSTCSSLKPKFSSVLKKPITSSIGLVWASSMFGPICRLLEPCPMNYRPWNETRWSSQQQQQQQQGDGDQATISIAFCWANFLPSGTKELLWTVAARGGELLRQREGGWLAACIDGWRTAETDLPVNASFILVSPYKSCVTMTFKTDWIYSPR